MYHELHLHDHYSTLDGLNTPEEYMVRAKELGMTHLAQTNHGTLSGHRDFQREAKKAGITPILGVEAYISSTDRFDRRAANKREDGTQTFNHIGLLAMNANGLKNLNLMMSEAWKTGFYHKPRIDMELLEEFQEDIIVLSGCLNGLLSKSLERDEYDRALNTAKHMRSIFGERFFIEIQGHNPKDINSGLLRLAEATGALTVVTSDCHYARSEDLWVEEAMLIISTNPKADPSFDFSKSQKMDYLERFNYLYPDRKMTFQEFQIYLRSAVEQKELLSAQGIGTEPIENTNVVAEMIGEYPYWEGLDVLPRINVKGKTPSEVLRDKVYEGMRARGHDTDPERVAAVELELKVISDMGFDRYFIIEEDLVGFAKENDIFVGPGRGSAVSSAVCFYLGITGFDPKPYNLQFFRFLDPERPDWPDVDTDFEIKRRHEVVEYANRVYKHTAKIATFGYFKDNSAIRDAARVFKIPVGEVNKALKGVEKLEQFKTSPSTAEFRRKYPEVIILAERLQGRIRSMGMHAGGLVMASQPIENFVPMQTAKDPNDEAGDRVPVVGYDMKDVADIGMIKFDILGLKCLTVIKDTVKMIKERHRITIDPYDIDLEDKGVYEMLSSGYTKGVFQCEAGPYTKMILKMGGVQEFNDLVASNALVRPGAANSSIGENYIKGKMTGEFEYIHACTEYFSNDTYGQMLFQEQTMLLCKELAGMTMGEANKVRKAIGKKILEDLILWKPRFIEGAATKIGEKRAGEVWDDLEKSAEYQFNKAHSVGYSMLSYWTAWFKLHYPLEFMTATLKHETDKDSRLDYLMEAKRIGVKILLPHINESNIENEIQNDSIRLGLSSIKYISGKVGAKIVDNGPYDSYEHVKEIAGTKGSGINSRAVDAMNKVGACAFPDNPRTGNEREFFFEYLDIPAFDSKLLPPHVKVQFRDLDEYTEDETFVVCAMVRGIRVGNGWSLIDMVDETGSAGAFSGQNTPIEKGKMYVILVSNNRIARYVTTDELLDGKAGALGKYLEKEVLDLEDGQYRCISFNTRTTKAGKKMADAVFTDRDKNLTSAMVFSSMVEKATIPCVTASKIRPVFDETRDGARYLKGI